MDSVIIWSNKWEITQLNSKIYYIEPKKKSIKGFRRWKTGCNSYYNLYYIRDLISLYSITVGVPIPKGVWLLWWSSGHHHLFPPTTSLTSPFGCFVIVCSTPTPILTGSPLVGTTFTSPSTGLLKLFSTPNIISPL